MIEKMKTTCIIGEYRDLDKVSRLVVMNGSTQMINAISELNYNSLNLPASRENMQAIKELAQLRPYIGEKRFSDDEGMIKFFQEFFNLEPRIVREHLSIEGDYEIIIKELKEAYDRVRSISDSIREKTANIEKLHYFLNNAAYLEGTELEIEDINNMSFLEFKLLVLPRENLDKLKLNIENVPSAVYFISAEGGNTVMAAVTPKSLKEDAERIFASLNCSELELPKGYSGTASSVMKQIREKIRDEKKQISELRKSIEELGGKYADMTGRAYTLLELEKRAEKVRLETALGQSMFFMMGFVPESESGRIQEELNQCFGDRILFIADNAESRRNGQPPPTRMKNNPIFKPFEMLIAMYGVPNYGEKDPTPFFALSYMLLFGAMFGDLGQGLIIFLGGLLIGYKTANKGFGGILARLGISSMAFGVAYGSVFGSEELIRPFVIRPMASIDTMLVSALALGVGLITISYIYGLANHFNSRDIEEGLFGREGLAGFLFFLALIIGVSGKAIGKPKIGMSLPLGIMAILLIIMVFKKPLADAIEGRRSNGEAMGDYYVEAGFGMIETVLSVASNIISFVRVGAFALNHAGLYIAFATMAEMMNSKGGGIIILVIGNIIIIGLEGLIVFIQSLRLEYYELFSRYYSGYGIEYDPIGLGDHYY